MSLPFMPMYWGDYWRDTTHLSDAEHVSYLRLISHYWQHGSLPDDDVRLSRIAGRSEHDWLVMKPMLQAFFEHCWRHARIDRELARQTLKHEGNTVRAKRAAEARWNKNQPLSQNSNKSSNAQSMRQALPDECLTNANQNQNQNQILEVRVKPSRSSNGIEGGFSEFWSLYPRKIAKGAAEKSWVKAVKEADEKIILEGLRVFQFSSDPQFIPHPATWLNQRRWEDGPALKKLTLAERFALTAMDSDLEINLISFEGESNG